MKRSHKALLALTLVALCVGIVNGVLDIYVKAAQTFTASVATPHGEKVSVRIEGDTGRPPFLWMLAWQVSGQTVSTVTNAISITVTGTNVQSTATVDYYIKAVSASDSQKWTKTLDVSGASATVGTPLENSTGAMTIDGHLADMGLSTTESQTVDYYIYVKATTTGLISGQQLVAEVAETKFDTVQYLYGVPQTFTMGYSGSLDEALGTVAGYIIGTCYQVTAPHNGTLDYITAKLYRVTHSNDPVRAALYEHVSDSNAGDLIAQTEEKTVPETTWTWVQFNFETPKPEVTEGTTYFLTVWFPMNTAADWKFKAKYISGNPNIAKSSRYSQGKDFPSPLTEEVAENKHYRFAIYASGTYLTFGASWWSLPPLSLVSIPAGQQILAAVAAVIAGAVVLNTIRRRRRRRR